MTVEAQRLARELYGVSVLKQEKLRRIAALIGETAGRACLDIGSDNGVISLLLRERGGSWTSAELDETSVASIRELVGEPVHRIDGRRMPFADGAFDLVVVVDFLEHVHTDSEFAAELRRILKQDGRLVVNVPHLKPRSLLNRLRHAIGQTDERHGHVRAGYSLAGLDATLSPWFVIREARTYSRAFSEILDTVLRLAVERTQQRAAVAAGAPVVPVAGADKGALLTPAELGRRRRSLALLKLTYPALWLFSQLDRLLFLQPGYKLIVRAEVDPAAEPRGVARA